MPDRRSEEKRRTPTVQLARCFICGGTPRCAAGAGMEVVRLGVGELGGGGGGAGGG